MFNHVSSVLSPTPKQREREREKKLGLIKALRFENLKKNYNEKKYPGN